MCRPSHILPRQAGSLLYCIPGVAQCLRRRLHRHPHRCLSPRCGPCRILPDVIAQARRTPEWPPADLPGHQARCLWRQTHLIPGDVLGVSAAFICIQLPYARDAFHSGGWAWTPREEHASPLEHLIRSRRPCQTLTLLPLYPFSLPPSLSPCHSPTLQAHTNLQPSRGLGPNRARHVSRLRQTSAFYPRERRRAEEKLGSIKPLLLHHSPRIALDAAAYAARAPGPRTNAFCYLVWKLISTREDLTVGRIGPEPLR